MYDNGKIIDVWINPNPPKAIYEIWVKYFSGGKEYNVTIQNGTLNHQEIIEASAIADYFPFMSVPMHFGSLLLPALLEAIQNRGIQAPKEATMEGELKATKLHLADMQTISEKLLKLIEMNL